MISKGEFVTIINALKEADELQDKINELMRSARDNIRNDFMNAGGIMICHTDIVIDLLGKIFDDKGEWIAWFAGETGYGKRMTEVYDKEDNVIADIKMPEDLYDFLLDQLKE